MIAKKMMLWIGAGLLTATAIPALAITGHKLVTKAHTKVAHGSAHAAAKSKGKVVAAHGAHAGRTPDARHSTRVHATNALHATHAVHASHVKSPASKSVGLGVTSMHSGKSGIGSTKAAVKGAAVVHTTSITHVKPKVTMTALPLSSVGRPSTR